MAFARGAVLSIARRGLAAAAPRTVTSVAAPWRALATKAPTAGKPKEVAKAEAPKAASPAAKAGKGQMPSAADLANITLPMRLDDSTASKVAGLMFKVGVHNGNLSDICKELDDTIAALEGNKTVATWLQLTCYDGKKKADLIGEELAEQGVSDIVVKTIQTILEHATWAEAAAISKSLHKLRKAQNGEVDGILTVAEKITDAQLNEIKAQLSKHMLSAGQKLLLTTKVDPTILGGFVASVGNKAVDLSVKKRVQESLFAMNQA